MENKTVTKTENKTVVTKTKVKSRKQNDSNKDGKQKKATKIKSRFEDALIEWSYGGGDGFEEMKGYLVDWDICNERQLFLVAVTDGILQDIRPTGIKNIDYEIDNVYFRNMIQFIMEDFLGDVDHRLNESVDTYGKMWQERGLSKK